MRSSSLQSKTVRPGLTAYSFYRSDRRPVSRSHTSKKSARPRPYLRNLILFGFVALAIIVGFKSATSQSSNSGMPSSSSTSTAGGDSATNPVSTVNACSNNSLPQYIIVSIGQRRLWACQGTKVVYNSPVITGMENLAADKTPTGTYRIYAKQTKVTLTGSDTTGHWSDPVDYWMPFLDNQYGTYGFHDATWRPNSAFGNISPASSDASHGCVEMPLATSKWLYDWSHVGTTVTVAD